MRFALRLACSGRRRSRRRPRVDDVLRRDADVGAARRRVPRRALRLAAAEADLLGPDADLRPCRCARRAAPARRASCVPSSSRTAAGAVDRAGEQVRDPEEARDERRRRAARRARSACPSCSIRPAFMIAIWSAIVIASSWSCVTWTNVIPTSCWMRFSSSCISLRSFRSSAPSGSSSSSTRGRLTSARASATRCCWPPGKLARLARLAARSSPTSSSASLDAARQLARRARPCGAGRTRRSRRSTGAGRARSSGTRC